jgi:hypothetical protein
MDPSDPNAAYLGRILVEEQFLKASREANHPRFDVLRHPDVGRIHPEKLRQSARAKSVSGDWTLSTTCATAVAEVLEQASDRQFTIERGPLDALFATYRSPTETDLLRPDRFRQTGFEPVVEKYETATAEQEAAGRPVPQGAPASIALPSGPSAADKARAGELRARAGRLRTAVDRCESRIASGEIGNCTVNLSWEGGRAVTMFEAASLAAEFEVEAARLDP